MARSGRACAFLDEDQAAKLKPSTLLTYRNQVGRFTTWAIARGEDPVESEEWDELLVLYKNLQREEVTKAQFISLLAGVEFFMPRLKNRLTWSHSVVAGWNIGSAIKHTVPLGKLPSKLMAVRMGLDGTPKLAVGLVLQTHTGLRPSEMLALRPEHVQFPEELGVTIEQRPVFLLLGPKTGTKVKREQVATLTGRDGDVVMVLRHLCRQTPQGLLLFPHSMSTFRAQIGRAEASIGLSVGWGPQQWARGICQRLAGRGDPIQRGQRAGSLGVGLVVADILGHRGGVRDRSSSRGRGTGADAVVAEAQLDKVLRGHLTISMPPKDTIKIAGKWMPRVASPAPRQSRTASAPPSMSSDASSAPILAALGSTPSTVDKADDGAAGVQVLYNPTLLQMPPAPTGTHQRTTMATSRRRTSRWP